MNFDFYAGRITVNCLEGEVIFIELDEVMKYPDRVDYIPLDRCYVKFNGDSTISVRFVKDKKRYTYIVGYTDALDEIQIIMSKCWDSVNYSHL